MEHDHPFRDNETYTVRLELDLTIADALAFRTAIAKYAEDASGTIAMVDQSNALETIRDFAMKRVLTPGLWPEPGLEVRLGASSAARYVPVEDRSILPPFDQEGQPTQWSE